MSMTCENCVRRPPLSLMPFGQRMTVPLRVPPKSEATCLVHENGVSNATAQPAAMCGKVSGPPHLSIRGMRSSTFSVTPLKYVISLYIPTKPPSALVPLSPAM